MSESPASRPLSSLRKKALLWASATLSAACLLTACQTTPGSGSPSSSTNAASKSYRKDAAQHLYSRNSARIYQGMLPPMLYAIGVLQVQIDGQGRIKNLHWMRKPSHAPEVVAEIERTVRAAAPFPATGSRSVVTYTDTWLWDKSGRSQLDTLSEGQRGE